MHDDEHDVDADEGSSGGGAPIVPTPFEPGIRDDLAHRDYLTIPAFSASLAKRMIETSPMHAEHDRRHPPPEKRSTALGSVTHMAILEPHRLECDVSIVPSHAPRRPSVTQRNAARPSQGTIDAIEWWDAWSQHCAGRLALTMDQFDRAVRMGEAVRRHPIAADLLSEGRAEVTMQWRDARLDIPCKARIDWLTPDDWIVDVKTCRDASPDGFRRASVAYGYHLQEAHYRWGYEHLRDASPRGFLFVVVEPDPPHGVAVYVMPPNAVHFGGVQVIRAMNDYARATRRNFWPGYPQTVLPVPFSRFDLQVRTPEIDPRVTTAATTTDHSEEPAHADA